MPRSFVELTPQNFSFNSPLGWCPACQGLGTERGTNQESLVSNPNLTLLEGAVSAWPNPQTQPGFRPVLDALAREFGIPLDRPWYLLEPAQQRVVLYGSGDRWIELTPGPRVDPTPESGGQSRATKSPRKKKPSATDQSPALSGDLPGSEPATAAPGVRFQYKGLYPAIEEASRVSYDYRQKFVDLIGEKPCSVCHGDRIRDDASAVQLNDLSLPQLCRLPLAETLAFLKTLQLTASQRKIAGDLLNEAIHRLSFLVDVGLDYLTLDRAMPTLSGGESQRIRLAGQIGRALTGVLYVLDEPTIGLHPRDNGRLIEALHRLRDLGNTVVLVEHDREVLDSADRLYDFGPGAGRYGGNITAEGTPAELKQNSAESLTGAYLSGEKSIPIPQTRRMRRTGPPAAS